MVVSPSPSNVESDLLDDQQEVVGHEYVPTTPEGSDGEKVVFLMIVRSEERLKWSLHLILTLPGDAQHANPGWMFLEFVTMLSVERS